MGAGAGRAGGDLPRLYRTRRAAKHILELTPRYRSDPRRHLAIYIELTLVWPEHRPRIKRIRVADDQRVGFRIVESRRTVR